MKPSSRTLPARSSAIAIFLLLPLAAAADSVPFAMLPPAAEAERPAPRLLFEALSLEPAALLPAAREAAAAEVEALASWNAAGRQPQKAGFVRLLPSALEVDIAAGGDAFAGSESRGLLLKTAEGLTWVTRVEAAEASRLRLRLRALELPEGAEMMVYNALGESVRFGRELLGKDGELWTPSVAGPAIFLEIHSPQPAARHRFEIDAIGERFELDAAGRPLARTPEVNGEDTSCLIDSPCVTTGTLSTIVQYRAAVAHIVFNKDGGEFICSASLLNDRDDSGFIPYLLTANHCFSTQSSASSIEAFWDYHAATCGGAVPSLGNLPRSNGSQLLASAASSDFTLVKLNTAPAGPNGRIFLGWDSNPVPDSAVVYGLHYPLGDPQSYTRSRVDRTPASVCDGAPTSRYLYVNTLEGATFGGSSGSPITTAGLAVVGQLLGGCVTQGSSTCDPGPADYDVFGAFSETFDTVDTWLNQTGGGTNSCVDGPNTLCLLNNRFKVEATWRTAAGQTGPGKAVRLTQETGYFWFFSQTNIEAVFKLLNACTPSLGNHFWVFAGGLTDVEVTTTVTDTTRTGPGSVKTYFNPLGTPFKPITDLGAFDTCP
jgi:hypothetical protein